MKYLLLLLILAGCGVEFIDPFSSPVKNTVETYLIPKGENKSEGRWPGLVDRSMEFDFLFEPDVLHVQDSTIHKLYGMSDSKYALPDSHLKASARAGWRVRADSTVDIFAYWHTRDGSKRNYAWMGNIDVKQNQKDLKYEHFSIRISEDYYIFKFQEREVRVNRKGWVWGLKYRLFPYYESDQNPNTAPQDMHIHIMEYK